jgi:hypothetical protein
MAAESLIKPLKSIEKFTVFLSLWHSVVLILFHKVKFVERMFQTSKRIVAKILYFIIPADVYLSSLFVKNVNFYSYLVTLLEGSNDAHVPMQFQSIHISEYCWPSSVHLFQSFISCSLICRFSWLILASVINDQKFQFQFYPESHMHFNQEGYNHLFIITCHSSHNSTAPNVFGT